MSALHNEGGRPKALSGSCTRGGAATVVESARAEGDTPRNFSQKKVHASACNPGKSKNAEQGESQSQSTEKPGRGKGSFAPMERASTKKTRQIRLALSRERRGEGKASSSTTKGLDAKKKPPRPQTEKAKKGELKEYCRGEKQRKGGGCQLGKRNPVWKGRQLGGKISLTTKAIGTKTGCQGKSHSRERKRNPTRVKKKNLGRERKNFEKKTKVRKSPEEKRGGNHPLKV